MDVTWGAGGTTSDLAHVSTDSLTVPGDHGRLHSLSFEYAIYPLMENNNRDLDLKSKLSSPVPANGSSSGLFMENELMRIDHRMSEQQAMEEDWDEPIELMTSVCIDGMAEMSMDRRLWNNLIPIHSAVIFRCFIHWNVFEENEENTHLILQGFVDGVTRAIQEEENANDLEQSYWLLRLTTLIYWVHVYYPQRMIVVGEPQIRRYETFE
eukprot:824743_1